MERLLQSMEFKLHFPSLNYYKQVTKTFFFLQFTYDQRLMKFQFFMARRKLLIAADT